MKVLLIITHFAKNVIISNTFFLYCLQNIYPVVRGDVMKNRFAIRLRNYRDYAGETRAELGAAIGATVSAIRSWEEGRHNCSFDDLISIAEHYGITTDYLIGNTPLDEPGSAKKQTDLLLPEDRYALVKFEEFLLSKQRQKQK